MTKTFTDADFDKLSFHDVHVYGYVAIPERFEIRFDIDYLVEWLCSPKRFGLASFRISPATLVFHNVSEFRLKAKSPQGFFTLSELRRSDYRILEGASVGTWRFELPGQEDASASLRASGFTLHLRAEPVERKRQHLTSEERGPASFAVPGKDDSDTTYP